MEFNLVNEFGIIVILEYEKQDWLLGILTHVHNGFFFFWLGTSWYLSFCNVKCTQYGLGPDSIFSGSRSIPNVMMSKIKKWTRITNVQPKLTPLTDQTNNGLFIQIFASDTLKDNGGPGQKHLITCQRMNATDTLSVSGTKSMAKITSLA